MTKNQLDYWANKERERNNRIVAAENMSHNEQMERIEDVKAQSAYLRGLASHESASLSRDQWENGGKDLLSAQIASTLAGTDLTQTKTQSAKGTTDYRKGATTKDLDAEGSTKWFGAAELGADILGNVIGNIIGPIIRKGLGNVGGAGGYAGGYSGNPYNGGYSGGNRYPSRSNDYPIGGRGAADPHVPRNFADSNGGFPNYDPSWYHLR